MSLAIAPHAEPPSSPGVRDRADALRLAAQAIRDAELSDEPESERLEIVGRILADLAARTELFPARAFPLPEGSVGGLYRLVEFADQKAALYMSVGLTGRKAQPHTHATWAAVAGVSGGIEFNRLYDRTDDGSTPGHGRLALRGEKAVGPGEVVLLPSGVFHTIEVVSDTPVLHLHAYGRAVDAPTDQPLPAFKHPDATTYTLREAGRFSPPLSTVTWTEAVSDVASGRAAVIDFDIAARFQGPYVIQANAEPVQNLLDRLGSPPETPIILAGPSDQILQAARVLYRSGFAILFQLA